MQSKGSLKETSLRSLLEGAQAERATGVLTVRDNGRSYALYFLFGHLFHASGEGATGDDAVVGALRVNDGEFAFDAKAKLPADETVKSSIPDLVGAAGANGTEAHGEHDRGQEEEMPEEKLESAPLPAAQEETGVRRGVKHRPTPKHGREPIPVPAGEVVYDSLKTSFVDFPRLITTLENEAYTGYVRLLTETASGLILFREGKAQECVFDAGESITRGREALLSFNAEVTHGHGVLDVVGLPDEIVDGLYDLVVARPMYTELYASWIDMPALLDFLGERQLTGSVMVRSDPGTGVIILTEGKPSGAYTSESKSIEADTKVVLDLCKDKSAMIEVKAADHSAGRPPLNVDEIVGSRRVGRTSAASPVPAAPPTPTSPPPAEAAPPQPGETAPAFTPPPTTPMPAYQPSEPSVEAQSAAQARPEPPTAETPPTPGRPEPNWDVVIEELQAMADKALGARSRKVKDLLASADRSREGVESTVSQVSQISLLFVDSALLVNLEQDMKERLKSL